MERFRQLYGISLTRQKLHEMVLMLVALETVFCILLSWIYSVLERIDDFDARSRDCCGNDSGCEGQHSCGVRVRSFIHVDWNICDSGARQAVLSDRQRDAAQLAVTCGSENNFCTNHELDVRHIFSEATQACLRRNFTNRDRRYAASRICNLPVAVSVFPDAARDRNWEYFVVSMASGLGIGYFVGRCLLRRTLFSLRPKGEDVSSLSLR